MQNAITKLTTVLVALITVLYSTSCGTSYYGASENNYYDNYYDLKVFLSVGAKEQSRRILRRNGPDLHQRFLREWIPMENRYFQEMKIQERCDFVFRSNEILF